MADPVDFEKWMPLINAAKEKGCLVSLDPNIRPSLIDDVAEFSARMTRMAPQAKRSRSLVLSLVMCLSQ